VQPNNSFQPMSGSSLRSSSAAAELILPRSPVRYVTTLILLLALASATLAGAWGAGSFENDDALDWVSELIDEADTGLVYITLEEARSQPYLEAPTASSAVAAAEAVAAMLGHPSPALPPDLETWLQRHKQRPTATQLALARDVMKRVLDVKVSELAQLWAKEDATKWRDAIGKLLDRLDTKE